MLITANKDGSPSVELKECEAHFRDLSGDYFFESNVEENLKFLLEAIETIKNASEANLRNTHHEVPKLQRLLQALGVNRPEEDPQKSSTDSPVNYFCGVLRLQRVATVLEVKRIDGFDPAKASQDFLSRTKSDLRGLQKQLQGGVLSLRRQAKKISELASALGYEIEDEKIQGNEYEVVRDLKAECESQLAMLEKIDFFDFDPRRTGKMFLTKELEGATLERVRIIAGRLTVDVQSLLPEQTLVASLITSITDKANELANICKDSSEISVGRDEVHPRAKAKSQILNAATEIQGVTTSRFVPMSQSDLYRSEKQVHVV